jgi:hypothetical protein
MKFLAASNDHGETNITRQQIAGLSKQIELANSRLAQLLFAANKIDKHLGLDKLSKPEPVAQPVSAWRQVNGAQEKRIKEIHDKLGTGFVTHEMMMHACDVNRKCISNLLYSVDQDPNWTRVQEGIGGNKSMYKIVKNNA